MCKQVSESERERERLLCMKAMITSLMASYNMIPHLKMKAAIYVNCWSIQRQRFSIPLPLCTSHLIYERAD